MVPTCVTRSERASELLSTLTRQLAEPSMGTSPSSYVLALGTLSVAWPLKRRLGPLSYFEDARLDAMHWQYC
jgi:hypothetical protein